MKKNAFLLLIACCFFVGCSSMRHLGKHDSDSKIFVGTWTGINRVSLDLTMWVQQRFADGTYTIIFFNIYENEVIQSVERGKWWIKDGRFYERMHYNKKADVYDYTIESEDAISFKNISIDYQFIDERITEDYMNYIDIKTQKKSE